MEDLCVLVLLCFLPPFVGCVLHHDQVITGHSERRVGFGEGGESSDLVAEKTKVCVVDSDVRCVPCRICHVIFYVHNSSHA